MHRQMADVMKAMGKQKGGLFGKIGSMLGGGGMPDLGKMDPAQIEKMAKDMGAGGGLPPGMPSLPPGLGNMPGLPGGFPGLGGPRLPGLPGLGKGPKRK